MAGKKPLFSADAAEEYFSTLLTYYRNTGNDIFKRDNEGRHVSDQIYSAEYQKYLGMQIAMREVLEYFTKFELGDTALRQQEAVTKCRDLFDEDGGEILSNSSEMTLDDAIAHLDNTLSDTGRKWSCESCRQEHVQLRAWLAELREIKQNRNEPLTLGELRSAYKFGCPVWLVGMEDGDGWVFIHHVDSCSVRYARIGTSEEWCFRTKSYGVRVWAYRQKPKEVQN